MEHEHHRGDEQQQQQAPQDVSIEEEEYATALVTTHSRSVNLDNVTESTDVLQLAYQWSRNDPAQACTFSGPKRRSIQLAELSTSAVPTTSVRPAAPTPPTCTREANELVGTMTHVSTKLLLGSFVAQQQKAQQQYRAELRNRHVGSQDRLKHMNIG